MMKLLGKVKSMGVGVWSQTGKSQLMERFYKLCIYATPLIIGLYLTVGRIFLYSGGPIHATDLETPLNPVFYYWSFLYPWHPSALGSRASYTLTDAIYGFISIVSFGSTLMSQILILSLPPIIAYTGTLLLTRRILRATYAASVFASFFYAFSPAYLAWFTLPYMLGVAFVPWLFCIGLKVLEHIFNHRGSFRTLLFYSLAFALILSLLTGLYFHILPLILILLAISCVFMIIALPSRATKRHIFWLGVFMCLTGFLYFLASPRIFDLFSTLRVGSPILHTPLDLIKNFYQEATILNSLKLAGGTPINERFILLRGNPIGFFIPILAFSGLLFIRNKEIRHFPPQKTILLYTSFIVNSIVLLTIAYAFRELAFSDSNIVTNMYFAGLRRPERILEMLSLFYSLEIAFSVSIVECKLRKHGVLSPSFKKRKCKNLRFPLSLSHRKISLMLLIILMLSYVSYSGMYVEPSHPVNSQLFSPRPADFKAVEDFLNRDEIQASKYDAIYRYSILPLYSPLTAYFRYNYPNIFYAGSFAPNYVQDFIKVTNELVAEKDPSVVWPLSLSSVKYIAILPPSFSEDEFQSWRLKGEIKISGASLFGDPRNYNAFISNLSHTRLLYEDKMAVYVNELAIPRVFVPAMLVHAQGNLKDVFKTLRLVDSVFPLRNFALVVNQSELTKSQSLIIEDFSSQVLIKASVFNLTELNFKYKSNEEVIGLELYINDTLGENISQEDSTMFPIVVDDRKNMTVLWPIDAKGGVIEYAVSAPIELNEVSLLAISKSESDTGWLKVSEKTRWLSPVDINIDLEISLLGREGGNEILVPIFFGNAYDRSWKLRASASSGRIMEIVHVLGNGYGNLWSVRISEIQNTEGNLSLSFNIYWDRLELYLLSYTFAGEMLLLLAVPLYIFCAKKNKPSEGKSTNLNAGRKLV